MVNFTVNSNSELVFSKYLIVAVRGPITEQICAKNTADTLAKHLSYLKVPVGEQSAADVCHQLSYDTEGIKKFHDVLSILL